MTAQRKVIKHQFHCKHCDFHWEGYEVYSQCIICKKEVVAKICITKVESITEGENDKE